MTDYSQSIDFSTKDGLTTGDPNKLIKGADIDTELGLISTAIASKSGDAENNTISGNWTHSGTTTFSGSATFTGAVTGIDYELISSVSASGAAQIEFTGLVSTYQTYLIQIAGLQPATNSVQLQAQLGTGGTPTYITGATYDWVCHGATTGSQQADNGVADTKLCLSDTDGTVNFGTAAGQLGSYRIEIHNHAASAATFLRWEGCYEDAGSDFTLVNGGGREQGTTAVTAIKVFFSTGNITGEARLYGLRNA